MNRSDQNQILHGVAVAYQVVHRQQIGYFPTRTGTVESFRAALRLDDPLLACMVAISVGTGRKLEWETAVPA